MNSTQHISKQDAFESDSKLATKPNLVSYRYNLPVKSKSRVGTVPSNLLAITPVKDTSGMADRFLQKFDLLRTQTAEIEQTNDPITEIEKKLNQFTLKHSKRPLSSHKKAVINTHPSFGEDSRAFLDKKDQQVNTVESLRHFRRKMRAKLTTECFNRKNKSVFQV